MWRDCIIKPTLTKVGTLQLLHQCNPQQLDVRPGQGFVQCSAQHLFKE